MAGPSGRWSRWLASGAIAATLGVAGCAPGYSQVRWVKGAPATPLAQPAVDAEEADRAAAVARAELTADLAECERWAVERAHLEAEGDAAAYQMTTGADRPLIEADAYERHLHNYRLRCLRARGYEGYYVASRDREVRVLERAPMLVERPVFGGAAFTVGPSSPR